MAEYTFGLPISMLLAADPAQLLQNKMHLGSVRSAGDRASPLLPLAADLQMGVAQNFQELLAPTQLIKGTVSVMERVPEAAFGLSDLTANLCQQDDGKMRVPVLEQLLANLRGTRSVKVESAHDVLLQALMGSSTHPEASECGASFRCKPGLARQQLRAPAIKGSLRSSCQKRESIVLAVSQLLWRSSQAFHICPDTTLVSHSRDS